MIVIYHFEAKNSKKILDPTQLLENALFALLTLVTVKMINVSDAYYPIEDGNLSHFVISALSVEKMSTFAPIQRDKNTNNNHFCLIISTNMKIIWSPGWTKGH